MMRHAVATLALVASLMLMTVAEASSTSGIAAGAAMLMSTTGLVQARRGYPLITTGSFQLSSGGAGHINRGQRG